MLDKELLNILACPECKSDIYLKDDKIVCLQCGKEYSIKNGIPIMLIDGTKQTTQPDSTTK